MRVQVNLATRPFVELRPFFLRLRLIMGALVLAGLGIALGAHVLSARAEKQQAQLDLLRDQTIAAQQAKLHTEARMRQPVNAAVLDRAHFLNTVFLRKSFSWTAVMMDLENVLPAGVQVTSIEPGVSTNGDVIIRLRVAGDRDRAVQLVRNLERSRRFLQPRLGSESTQAREGGNAGGLRPPVAAPGIGGAPGAFPGAASGGIPGAPAPSAAVEFEILANYNPLPANEPYRVEHTRAVSGDRLTPVAAPSEAATATAPATAVPAAIPGVSPTANLRRGFPRNGVVLPPYTGPSSSGVRSSPSATQPGGPQ